MESESFETRSEAIEAVARGLGPRCGLSVPDAARLVAAAGLVAKVERPGAPPIPPARLSRALVRPFRYVIRNEDVASFETFVNLLKAALTLAIGIAAHNTLAGVKSLVDGTSQFYATFKGVLAKGAVLDEAEFAVFWVLKTGGGGTSEQVAERLRIGGTPFDAARVAAIMAKYQRRDGTGFLRQHPDGSWTLDGV